MDARELKSYIFENHYVEQILQEIGCHHIKYHSSGEYWTCANKDGHNTKAIVTRNNEYLTCNNYTRQMVAGSKVTDIIDLVCYTLGVLFPDAIKAICNIIGISYYYDLNEEVPESLKILKMIEEMSESSIENDDKPLKPISSKILTYYKDRVNGLFAADNIDFKTQKIFQIGYDEYTNRITIPIFSEIGDLVGVKGRLLKEKLEEDDLKYLYLEPCSRSRVLYGLNLTINYIKKAGKVFVVEAEKGAMQLWSYGFKNVVAIGGKTLSSTQIEMLSRLGVDIIFAFDKDVLQKEIEEIANRFMENIPIYAVIDINSILLEKESPTDNPKKWTKLINNNIYRLR